jgi:hypothetical protein
MSRLACVVITAALVVPASAGTTPARRSIALAASPAHVSLQGSGHATVRVTNSGRRPVVFDVRRAGFALDLRGRPRIVAGGKRDAISWVRVHPSRVALRAGASASLTVAAKVPAGAEPGDHDALVLLTTRPRGDAGVAVRVRIGVVIAVRAPGRLLHKLALRRLRIRRRGHLRTLELLVVNRGNVTERLGRERVSLSLGRAGRVLAKLRPEPRELLPRSRGLLVFRYRGRAHGTASAIATVVSDEDGSMVYRTYWIRL